MSEQIMLTIGSLFSGIGGLELGLERAGLGPTIWQVEKDNYCRDVLAKHWPDAQRFDDVCTVGAHNLSPVDLICGGFPCQDISYAGKGAGLAGARSGLWYEFARIIRELGPRYVLVENVRALATRGLDAVLGTLADLGYDAEWDCVSAASVGAPHRRERVFIVANSASIRREHASEVRHSITSQEREKKAAGERGLGLPARTWHTEPDVGRVAHGVPSRVDRLRGLGNAVVPQVAEYVGRLIVAAELERAA